ncbi:MAG TPA: aminodeoxychorismate synthase component I [Candidatus Hydrogenedentes bacterium]|nr:aminodeoxychorismate synthase component I [Candidatus Hydrogenedentota bacterium]
MANNDILFCSEAQTLVFRNPVEIIFTKRVEEVRESLHHIEDRVAAGLHAAGFITYEAAPAFDNALVTHETGTLPLLWFGLYKNAEMDRPEISEESLYTIGNWESSIRQGEYDKAIRRIHEWIAAGDTYQVNYTFPMHSRFQGDAAAWFRQLCRAQRANYCAFLETDEFQILSISPELFFRLEGEHIEMKPMKGTRPRGLYPETDERAARELADSEKDRAENLMIVDLIRNDLGRISEIGSVHVKNLFHVERYETVWQMTSTVAAQTSVSVPEIFSALFPSGSVTGAPKVRTMQIIRELEPSPRGVYCGGIGWWSPNRQAEFNVAIRTVMIHRRTGLASYHVGGGITWDSTAEGEFEECKTKAAILAFPRPEFELLESIRWDGNYFLLEKHLQRLQASARYFGFTYDRDAIDKNLAEHAREMNLTHETYKVRLLLARNGALHLTRERLPETKTFRVTWAEEPIRDVDVFLYHKTTHREVYNRARASLPGYDDVLLWNTRGEITESTIANVVVEKNGCLLTPPVSCGLLAGTFRGHLLATGKITEHVLYKDDLVDVQAVYLINSVRRWIPVQL